MTHLDKPRHSSRSLKIYVTLPSEPQANLPDENFGYHRVFTINYSLLTFTGIFQVHQGLFIGDPATCTVGSSNKNFLNQGEMAPSTRPWMTQGLLIAGSPPGLPISRIRPSRPKLPESMLGKHSAGLASLKPLQMFFSMVSSSLDWSWVIKLGVSIGAIKP